MAGSLNKVILIGNLGKDPDIRSTQDGREIASFSIATSDIWKDKMSGEKKEKTEWHKIVVFVPQIVTVVKNYIKKGSKVYVEGSLQTRKWLDQNENEKYTTEVIIQSYNSSLILLDNKSQDDNDSLTGRNDNSIKKKDNPFDVEDIDDDIPF